MIKLKDLINERIDFSETATQIVKSYKLKSKIRFGRGKNKGDYEWKSHKDYGYTYEIGRASCRERV